MDRQGSEADVGRLRGLRSGQVIERNFRKAPRSPVALKLLAHAWCAGETPEQCVGDQQRLIDRAAQWVEPGGALVYAVCSLEPQEGEEIVSAFLERSPDFALAAPKPRELPDFAAPSIEGWVRILPGLLEERGGLDGFFMARLVRKAG